MKAPFAVVLIDFYGLEITDTLLTTAALTVVLVLSAVVLQHNARTRRIVEHLYEGLRASILDTVNVDVTSMVPLILSLWLFIAASNLLGLIPGLRSPTGDLSLTLALALIAFFSGHLYAFKQEGWRYLRHYLEPSPWLLPLNLVGEISRTAALALRLFGNALSGNLIASIAVYLVGLLLPIPLLFLSLLTGLVQAYIFGILTLVFAASSVAAHQPSTKA